MVEVKQEGIRDILKDAGVLKEKGKAAVGSKDNNSVIHFSSRSSFKSYSEAERNPDSADQGFCNLMVIKFTTATSRMVSEEVDTGRVASSNTSTPYLMNRQTERGQISHLVDTKIIDH